MRLIVAGVGPGDPDLTSFAAIRAARDADLILTPCPAEAGRGADAASVAGNALRANLPDIETTPFFFPMTRDAEKRDAEILRQLEALRPKWERADNVLLPVIGDSAVYATGAYLYEAWRGISPELELKLIPGVSAHSLAASCARRFLAMDADILCVIPGTASPGRIRAALMASDAAAVYKPRALRGNLAELVSATGPWRDVVRVDRAGLPDERIFAGEEALREPDEYLSILLLRR